MGCSVLDEIQIGVGTRGDYLGLAGFHYRSHCLGAVTLIGVARHGGGEGGGRVAGVVVLSLPALACTLRNVATGGRYCVGDRVLSAAMLNEEVRCVSRVVVHPVYRGMGLAVGLVRWGLEHAGVPYVEALAAMGRVNPFFLAAGMREFDRPADARTVRVVAAMERVGLRAMDLCEERRWQGKWEEMGAGERAFFLGEMRRYARGGGEVGELVATVRTRVLSQPVYYFWERAGS